MARHDIGDAIEQTAIERPMGRDDKRFQIHLNRPLATAFSTSFFAGVWEIGV
jgi:hypothetical protein